MFDGKSKDDGSEHLNMKKFDDILKLLLSAGYFRARVEGPSMFDKVRKKKTTYANAFSSTKTQTDNGWTLLVYCSCWKGCGCKYFIQ